MSDIKVDTPAQEPVAAVAPAETPAAPAVEAPKADAPVETTAAPAVSEEPKKENVKPAYAPREKTFKKFISKSKYDASTLPISDNADEIRAQVRFLFPLRLQAMC